MKYILVMFLFFANNFYGQIAGNTTSTIGCNYNSVQETFTINSQN